MNPIRSVLLALAWILMVPAPSPGAAPRFYAPQEGYVQAKDLPADFRARVRSIRFDIRDAFDGSVAHSGLDRKLFAIGNRLHIDSRESTIRNRLLFREGGEVTGEDLAETERALRTEEFLADAIIAVGDAGDGACDVIVTTFDQFTTIPVAGGSVLGLKPQDLLLGRWDRVGDAEWFWSAGLFESNLLGTGTKVGAAIRHQPERDSRDLVFTNNNLFGRRLQVSAYGALFSDGDSVELKIAKPILSRYDRYAFGLSLTSVDVSERLYFDANRLDLLPDSLAGGGRARLLRVYDRVATHEFRANAIRSYGSALKFEIGPTFLYRDRHGNGRLGEADSAIQPYVPVPSSAFGPMERDDALPGVSASLYRRTFRTARNFRNLKWGESVETGWRLAAGLGMNQEWLGASNSHLHLSQKAGFSRFWSDAFYLGAGLDWQSFLSPAGGLDDGKIEGLAELYGSPHRLTATFLSVAWTNLFAAPRSRQLTLGEINGLTGYPSYYYSGQASFLAAAEQRLFPEFELLTFVPAVSVFLLAGNAFPAWSAFDPSDLHYSLGLGLRLGRSKSTLKTIQHINVSFPLGDRHLRGPAISILSKKNL